MKRIFVLMLILALLSLGVSSALAEEGTAEPMAEPTQEPAAEPTAEPTQEPTAEPTTEPTVEPTAEPTQEPTAEPTTEPTVEPTAEPTDQATAEPTTEPTVEPTAEPTTQPTVEPTVEITPTVTLTPTVEVTSTVEVSAGEIGTQTLTNIPFSSKTAVMDISGAGANFSLKYYDESSAGGGARGTNSGLGLSAYQMRLIDQSTDTNISGSSLKGSGILESDNPLAAVVFFGGTGSGGYREYEAYDSGGQVQPDTKFFLPNAFRQVPGAGGFNNSEIAIMNTDSSTDAVVDVLFVTDGVPKTVTVKPNSTYYYNLEGETGISAGVRQPAVFTSRNGQKITVISTQYLFTSKPVFVTKTAAFRQADAALRQYLPNIISQIPNGTSVVHFVQNIGTSPVDVTINYFADPTCSGCGSITKNATINPNDVFAVNPRIGELKSNWFGSAVVIQTTNTGSPSIVAFTNQINTKTGFSSGVNGRNPDNSASSVYCPYFISGIPNFTASSSSSAMQVQNVTGTGASIDVSVTFRPGIGSPSSTSPSATALTLADGERKNFNARVGSTGGLPNNWFGSVEIKTTTPGGKVAAIVNLYQAITSNDDALGSYNCIAP